MKISGIYKIESKSNNIRCYVGSAVNIAHRWECHLSDLRLNKHHSRKLQNHYNKYGESDLEFSILIGCDREDLIKHEQYFIDSYNPYFNCCKIAGSSLGIKRSDETKERCSKSATGRKGYWTGKRIPDSMIEKLRQSNIGSKHSEDHKRKIGEKSKGNKYRLGCKASEETKNKISESNKGKHSLPINIGNKWNLGRKKSDLHKQLVSESMRRYWENKRQSNG